VLLPATAKDFGHEIQSSGNDVNSQYTHYSEDEIGAKGNGK